MYIPNTENVPLMTEKGDVKINISTTNVQASYAVTDNIAVMANGYRRQSTWSDASDSIDSWEYTSNRFLAEGGIGYYKVISENFIFETYGGGGFGQVGFDYFDVDYDIENNFSANFSRFFVQPNIGYKNDFFEFAISSRISGLKFSGIKTNYSLDDLIDSEVYQIDAPIYFFFEPAITFRLGYKWAKLHFQTIYSNKLNIEPLNYRKLGINVGIYIDISKAYNK